MIARPPRRFTIADAMLLVGASALASLLCRDYLGSIRQVFGNPSVERSIDMVAGPACCIASACMLALIPIRLMRPRPPWRRLVRQPGFAACVAVAAALGFGILWCASLVAFRRTSWTPDGAWPFQQLWAIGSMHAWPAVAGAWLLLAASGRWKAEANWVDRLGRLLGVVWLAWPVAGMLGPWVHRLVPPL